MLPPILGIEFGTTISAFGSIGLDQVEIEDSITIGVHNLNVHGSKLQMMLKKWFSSIRGIQCNDDMMPDRRQVVTDRWQG